MMTAQRMTTFQEPGGGALESKGSMRPPLGPAGTSACRLLEDVLTRTQHWTGCLTSMLSGLCHCPEVTPSSCCRWRDGCPGRLRPCLTQATRLSRGRTQNQVSAEGKARAFLSPSRRVRVTGGAPITARQLFTPRAAH